MDLYGIVGDFQKKSYREALFGEASGRKLQMLKAPPNRISYSEKQKLEKLGLHYNPKSSQGAASRAFAPITSFLPHRPHHHPRHLPSSASVTTAPPLALNSHRSPLTLDDRRRRVPTSPRRPPPLRSFLPSPRDPLVPRAVGVLDRQTYQGGARGSRLCGEDRDRETENSKVRARTRDTRFI
jgi:hypothetical protein